MKTLTQKEEEIMNFFWEKGPLYVKEIQDFYPEPQPHINTLSTMVRILEEKGFVGHESKGRTYRYFALIDRKEFSKGTLKNVISRYFNNSLVGVVSTLIEEEDMDLETLKDLIRQVEQANKK